MDPEIQQQLIDIEQRIRVLEKMIALDRFKAEQEKTRRITKQNQIKADRMTVRIRYEDGQPVLAEYIKDPVKFNNLVRKRIIEKRRGKWIVHPCVAKQNGYLVLDEGRSQ